MKYAITLLFGMFCYSAALACSPIPQPAFDSNSYYAPTSGLSGESLASTLNSIIRNHQYYSYTPCTWVMLEQADEDPQDPNSVIGFYTRRSILKSQRDQGGNTPDYWNREHIWPKNHGFPNKSQYGYTDGHALRATDKSVNADRADHDFAEGGTSHWECSGCKLTSNTWEPPDEVKGDTARMMFYMAVRYDGGDNSGVSDLTLVDRITSVGELSMGDLCDLMAWHLEDPVSAAEQSRNDIIYSWQGNRNPFIDHPEFAVSIWGPACGIEPEAPAEKVPYPLWALVALGLAVITGAFVSLRR